MGPIPNQSGRALGTEDTTQCQHNDLMMEQQLHGNASTSVEKELKKVGEK
jgi:hypothetical protein